MSTLFLGVLSVIGAMFGAAYFAHALVLVLRPVLVRLLPDEFFGPDGFYVDTRNGAGIFDRRARSHPPSRAHHSAAS